MWKKGCVGLDVMCGGVCGSVYVQWCIWVGCVCMHTHASIGGYSQSTQTNIFRTVFCDQKLLIGWEVLLSLARNSTFPTGTPVSKRGLWHYATHQLQVGHWYTI